MPVSKKKRTTSQTPLSKSEPSSPPLPEQQEFQQHLRALAQSAVRTVLELVMREELDAFIGAAWGECSPKRKGYRNGTYTRDLVTSTGRLEEINVPRDREGQFHTQAFERYSRYEPHLAEGRDGDVCGRDKHATSVGEVAQTLLGVAGSREHDQSAQSDPHAAVRNLAPASSSGTLAYPVRRTLVHFSIRHGEKADSTIILTALGVDAAGNKEVLARRSCAEEDKDGWACLLQDLRSRGATHVDLLVTDGHEGLLAAASDLFSATPRQRCLVHKQRNVLNAIPRRERGEVQAELVGIWEQPTNQVALAQLEAFKAKYSKRYPEAVRSLAEEQEKTLTFYEFPATMHRHIQTTNAIESLFSNVRQRTDRSEEHTSELQSHSDLVCRLLLEKKN